MNALIVASLLSGDVGLLFGFPRPLMSAHEITILDWIVDYTSRYGRPPDVDRLVSAFDTFVAVSSPNPLADIYATTLQKKRNLYTREYLTNVQDELKKGADPLPIMEKLVQAIRGGESDVTLYTKFDRTSYHRKVTAYPYNIPQIDRYTGGISAGDLVYLVGRLGTGKTSFAVWMVTKWLQRGRRILMVSNENRADDIVSKVDAYIGGWNPIKKRTMEWSAEDKMRINTVQYIATRMTGEMVVPNRPVKNVSQIQSLIYTYRPDIVIVDGIYLMHENSSAAHWEKLTDVSRNLKRLADQEGVPIVGVTQANRAASDRHVEIGHIAYSDALAQDADLVLTINKEQDKELFVECIKNRWGAQDWGFFMRFFFETMSVRVFDPRYAPVEGESQSDE